MANCNTLFQTFNENISLTSTKKGNMTKSKDALRERIRKYFKENHPEYEPMFYIQGSYKMKTGIRTKDDICDLDDGVYFFRQPDVEPATLQSWIFDAVEGYTETKPDHRKKCVRNIFSVDYEIDIPVYYKVEGKEYQLAIKNVGWENSDPKAMVKWFREKKSQNEMILKIVKYLKAWGDYKRNKMPTGLSMTILSCNAMDRIVLNERDDISLKDILVEIKRMLQIEFKCIVPVVPFDNLFEDYDEVRRSNFISALDAFIKDAEDALKEKNQLKASKLWQRHLGDRFPDGEDKDEEAISNVRVIAGAGLINPWCDYGI